MINYILGEWEPNESQVLSGDINSDGYLDIIDIVNIVNIIYLNIKVLLYVYDSNKELEHFVKNPTHSFNDQLNIINKLSKLMNFSKILNNFLSILVF